jgi:MtN3 and saliva related transmembrane protein
MIGFFECLGWIAAVFTTFAFVPQVIKVSKSRSVQDISIGMYSILCSGILMWIAYGIHMNAIPLVIANVISFTLAGAILVMKIMWNKESSQTMN